MLWQVLWNASQSQNFFFSCSEDTESLLVIETEYHSSLLFALPSFWVVFLFLSSLPNIFLFWRPSETGYLSVAKAFGYYANWWWNWENDNVLFEIWHSQYSLLLSKELFLLWNPSMNACFPIGKFTSNSLRMLSGASMEEERTWKAGSKETPKTYKLAEPCLILGSVARMQFLWLQWYVLSFNSNGETIRVNLTNINWIVADLHVKVRLYITAGWWSCAVGSGLDTK